MRYNIIYLVLILFSVSCNTKSTHQESTEQTSSMSWAKGLKVTQHESYTTIDIMNPWKKGQILQSYTFVPQGKDVPENLSNESVIHTPVKNALVYSSVHANVIKELGHISAVKGVCDAQYFTIPEITKGVNNGTIVNAGSSMAPITEKIIALNPDVIILSPYQNSDYSELKKLNIPIIECADYMETTPLGRAEWIKLFGVLLDETEKADSIFNDVATSYQELKLLAEKETAKPLVLSETIINGTWYVPGGDSYMAQLFADAGGSYAWSDVHTTGSIPLDMPRVLEKAHEADAWLIKSFDASLSYSKLKGENELNAEFKAFKDKNIYFCDTGRTTLFQDFPFHPEVLLKEYIAIFHPGILSDYTTQYFKPLVDE